MKRLGGWLGWLGLAGAMAAAVGSAPCPAEPGAGADPVIRAEVRMVSVRVYITGPDGQPVAGLTPADFRLYDDDHPQVIRTLVAEKPPGPTANTRPPFPAKTPEIWPGRSFLLLLGVGGAEDPFGAADSLIRFVRQDLDPADRVAVMFFDRVTEFTTRHDQVITLLERYRDGRAEIETYYWQQAEHHGLAWRGSDTVPPRIRAAVESLFAGADVPVSSRWVPEGGRGGHEVARAIEILRGQPGPRCLLYLADQGMILPGKALVRGLANLANDARVTIFPFQTGGMGSGFSRNLLSNPAATRSSSPRGPLVLTDRDMLQAPTVLGLLATWTGGRAAVHSGLDVALDQMDRMTRHAYLLGYSPDKIRWNGRYHRIRVESRRPGLQLHYRRGYFATDREAPPLTGTR